MSKPAAKTANTNSPTVEEIAAVTEMPAPKAMPDNLLGKEVRVRSVYGDTYHLLTNVQIPQNSDKKIKVDEFALAQLQAGKWELVD